MFVRGILCYCSTTSPTAQGGPLYWNSLNELDGSYTTLVTTVNNGGN
jgi:hypothetical protein